EGATEWRKWLVARETSPAIDYWLGAARGEFSLTPARSPSAGARGARRPPLDWTAYRQTGPWGCRAGRGALRWDLSPLGYLATAAHGHLDALHLSLWLDEIAMVIDPGTGAYYPDRALRNWLSSRAAHNGPCPLGRGEWPRRLGPFLWEKNHG